MITALEKIQQEKAVEFLPFGSDERIRLTAHIIRTYYAKPAKNGEEIDDVNCFKFMALCRARKLNPAEGDAWPVGFLKDGKAEWSLITAHNAFLKRAEANQEFEGMKSGVIVTPWDCKICDGHGALKNKDGETITCKECKGRGVLDELEGDFVPDEHKDGTAVKLLGGWAIVFRKGKLPTYRRLRLTTFEKPFGQWLSNKAGMIVKTAEADALRSTFPTILGGMFIEPGHIDGQVIDIGEPELAKHPEMPAGPANSRRLTKPANVQQPAREPEPEPEPTSGGQPAFVKVAMLAAVEGESPEDEYKRLVKHVQECAKSVEVSEADLVTFAKKVKLMGPKANKIGEISMESLTTIANSYQADPSKWRETVTAK
jgi:hypothetical protein